MTGAQDLMVEGFIKRKRSKKWHVGKKKRNEWVRRKKRGKANSRRERHSILSLWYRNTYSASSFRTAQGSQWHQSAQNWSNTLEMDREEVEEESGFYLLDNKVMQLFGKWVEISHLFHTDPLRKSSSPEICSLLPRFCSLECSSPPIYKSVIDNSLIIF